MLGTQSHRSAPLCPSTPSRSSSHGPNRARADDRARPVPSRSVARAVEHALRHAGYEVLPLRNAEQAIVASVPLDVPLSVTMTASKGVDGTIDLTERLSAHGYSVTPHLAARMFRNKAHLADTVARLTDQAIHSIFVIAGDSTEPAGPFTDSLALLEQLATSGHPFRSIGVGGYPEGHAHISDDQVDRALENKARHATHIVTQMCFRGSTTATWARQVKRKGVDLPIRIGLPGAVTRQKLARISANIGLGQSARFLVKQNSMLGGSSYPADTGPIGSSTHWPPPSAAPTTPWPAFTSSPSTRSPAPKHGGKPG